MLGLPTTEQEVFYRDWRSIKTDYLLIGRVDTATGNMRIVYELYDVNRQARVYAGEESGPVPEARMLAR